VIDLGIVRRRKLDARQRTANRSAWKITNLTFITGSGFARVQSCGLQVCGRRPVDSH
jgi:hypothetical protein